MEKVKLLYWIQCAILTIEMNKQSVWVSIDRNTVCHLSEMNKNNVWVSIDRNTLIKMTKEKLIYV